MGKENSPSDLACSPSASSAPPRDATSEKEWHHAEAQGSQRRIASPSFSLSQKEVLTNLGLPFS
jgi:hypothetical protein